ncbi:MAG: hypothetical protein EHM23_00570 [Acidobacteria bacterium]|nr:MAG: hypothetical protein EHM23_00570 [Acidobacteriota bacterium]
MEDSSRRRFLTVLGSAMPVCWVAAQARGQAPTQGAAAPVKHKFEDKCGMSWEQMFHFAYSDGFIDLVTALAKKAGGERYLEVIKQANDEIIAEGMKHRKIDDRSLRAFTEYLRNQNDFWKHVVTGEIVEDSPNAVEVRVKECIWAKTFRQQKAADLGYACVCHPDFAYAKAFNPKMRMERTKTLMQGDECCNHRWVVEA